MKQFFKTAKILAGFLIIPFLSSCSKSSTQETTSGNPNIHLCGFQFSKDFNNGEAIKSIYWKNGVATALPKLSNSKFEGARSIYVNGNNIYITPIDRIPRYWKNGIEQTLLFPDDGYTISEIVSIVVVDNDIYACGYAVDKNGKRVATYWINGQSKYLTDSIDYIYSMKVVNKNVYILGSMNNASGKTIYKYWKNGLAKNITEETDFSNAKMMFVSDTDDVYFIGTTDTALPTLWKNGISDRVSYADSYSISAIDVVNDDVYVAGINKDLSDGKAKLTYWKNGLATYIKGEPKNTGFSSIKVIGKDVYTSGSGPNSKGIITAKYWKNGVVKDVDDLSTTTRATGIFVTNF
jgi:hypothetical protein